MLKEIIYAWESSIPSVEYVGEIIRCKDCMWFDDKDYGEPTRYCTWHESVVKNTDFCSYGERIEE